MEFEKHNKSLFNYSHSKYDITDLVYKFARLPPIIAHFLPQSKSGCSFGSRSQKRLAAAILRKGKVTCWFGNISVNMCTLEQLGYE